MIQLQKIDNNLTVRMSEYMHICENLSNPKKG